VIVDSTKRIKIQNLDIESVNLEEKEDGVYEGNFSSFRWNHTVEVCVLDNQITDIVRTTQDNTINEDVVDLLVNKIINEQDTQIDFDSQASDSRKSFLKAIENALSGK
jgi:uncharacterized protein with FMN-binding domain